MAALTAATQLERSLDWYADDTAVTDLSNDRSLTYAELGTRARSLGNALVDFRPSKGDRVATLMKNRAEFVTVDVAATLAGKIRIGLNTRLTRSEYEYILTDCEARTLVYDQHFAEDVEAMKDDVPVEEFVSVGCEHDFATEFDSLLDAYEPAIPDVDVRPGDFNYIMYTSGTTGKPKGAVHTQAGRTAGSLNHLANELDIGGASTMLHVAPLTHGSGSKLLTFLMKGARNVTIEDFDAKTMLETIEAEGVTHTFVVPTIIKRMLAVDDRAAYDTSSLEQISYGGEPIPAEILDEALSYFGSVFTQVYGAAEVPHPISVLTPADHETRDERLLQSAGRPSANVAVRIEDDDGTTVDPGEVGEIVVRGPNVLAEYWERYDATATAIEDGWFHTGDLGTLSEDGYLTIVGRKKDMIISGGLNVYPAQVEDVLQKHPAVREVAVVGVPHEKWGEMVTAHVVAEGDVDEADIQDFAKEHIASYKVPKEVRFADELPKGATGKILKSELEEDHA